MNGYLRGAKKMTFYERYQKAWDDKNVSDMMDLYHPEYRRIFHGSGKEQTFDELEDIMTRWLLGTKRNKRRCIYENNEIMVEHFVADFQDGSREAVLTVHILKDGLLWLTETGATPLV